MIVNPRVAIYTRSGTELYAADLSEFFLGLTPADYFGDVRALYDQYSGRFMVSTMARSPADGLRWVLLAVSDDSDAEGAWYKYAIDLRYIDGKDTGNVGDYAGFAVGPDTVQITADMFPVRGGSFSYAEIVVIPKQQLLDGQPDLTATYFTDIRNSQGEKLKTIQPARHFGPVQTPFLAAHVPFVFDRLEVVAVHDALGEPYLTTATVPCSSWTAPRVVEQKLGPPPYIWTHDSRVLEACWRDSQLYVGWHVYSGAGNVNHQAWVQIETAGWPSDVHVVQEGRTGGPAQSHWMGAITVNGRGSVGLGVSLAGPDQDPAAAFLWRRAADAPGQMRTPTIYAQGGGFLGTNYPAVAEWGDYSGACVDPLDDRTFWFANERALAEPGEASEEWWVWVCSFTPDACPADFNADRLLNTLDVLAFLNAWSARDPAADFNGDGAVNTLDVLAFLNAWNAGC